MNRIRLLALSGLACSIVAGLAVLAILFSPFGGGSTDAEDGTVKAAEESFSESAADPSGTDEGIQVHGDWVIEVRNQDGSLAERREFENALQDFGKVFLVRTLSRIGTPGVWAIRLPNSQAGGPCLDIGQVPPDCNINEPIASALDSYWGAHFPTLTVTGNDNLNSLEVVLQGNFDALNDGVIDRVETMQCYSTPPNANPAACNNTSVITSTTLQAPVNVLEGQQVLVTVRISFS
jgi:hypothetical protein